MDFGANGSNIGFISGVIQHIGNQLSDRSRFGHTKTTRRHRWTTQANTRRYERFFRIITNPIFIARDVL